MPIVTTDPNLGWFVRPAAPPDLPPGVVRPLWLRAGGSARP
jgi:hypothetical protein